MKIKRIIYITLLILGTAFFAFSSMNYPELNSGRDYTVLYISRGK